MNRYRIGIAALVVLAAVAIAAPGAGAAPGGPKILQLEYYVDYEGIGYRYNVAATIKGQASKVTARSDAGRAKGRLSGKIKPGGPGKLWFFRKRSFVKGLRADLEADEFASVVVRARGSGGGIRKRCSLELERDPQFGDYASGRCRKLN